MARFSVGSGSGDGAPGPQGPTGPTGPAGSDASTGNFVFDGNNMSTLEGITIGVNGVPGIINLSAYLGVDLAFSDTEGSGLKFPDDTIQTTAYVETGESSFVVSGGTLGTQPTFTGEPLFSGSYVKVGPQVHFQIQVDMDNITNFGTGQYYVELPFPAKYGYKFRQGCLHDISTGKDYEIGGHVTAGSSTLELSSTDTQSGSVFDIDFTATAPITLSTADNFHISGTYIMQEGI